MKLTTPLLLVLTFAMGCAHSEPNRTVMETDEVVKEVATSELSKEAEEAKRRAAMKKAVAKSTLLKMIGTRGDFEGGVVENVLSGGDLTTDLDEALKGTGGVAVAQGGGGLRAAGGGGGSASIADITDANSADRPPPVEINIEGTALSGPGALEKASFSKVLTLRKRMFKSCFDTAYRADKNLGSASLGVKYIISQAGRVASITLTNTSKNAPKLLVSCTVNRLKAIRFPAPTGGEVEVEHRVVFDVP